MAGRGCVFIPEIEFHLYHKREYLRGRLDAQSIGHNVETKKGCKPAAAAGTWLEIRVTST